ncbi:MAG TPA: BTAD domain-containing putative transcriptional regulator [Mycobacteriales bacterium]|nr:BTAD domain-containing putative transcriptional regulator [Mycobacteriales bacterium]
MTAAEFRLMGSMELLVGGAPVRLPGAAERGLLALLLLNAGRPVAATSLVDRLWTERALPADPVNALQLRVSKLRRALQAEGIDVIHREAAGYRADVTADQVDVHLFVDRIHAARAVARERDGAAKALAWYDEALGLWRGDPLAEFAGEGWATVEAARLLQHRVAVLTERAELALALGRQLEVVADLEPLVAADPRQESLAGLLMTALYRAGRQADALDVYARTRDELDEQLGLEPSAALRGLHQRILQQDPALATPPAAGTAGTSSSPPTSGTSGPPEERGTGHLAFVPRPRLVGREDDVATVAGLLDRERVVTLVGPGGAGKTSLALAVAHDLAARFEDKVSLCRLAPVQAADDLTLAVADALGVPLDGADAASGLRDRVIAYLAKRRMLLVLDNCEHLVDSVARFVDTLLSRAPDVTVLTTSREALAVPGEVQFAVSPLAVPPPGTAIEQVLDYPAARLFLERARAIRTGWELDEDDSKALIRVCAQLDGMPLALELAAARLSSLSLPELSNRLSDRFGLLTTGPRTAEARQRTLRATVEWSHDLLGGQEQQVFRRLAVFRGGWTLAAAESVASGEGLGAEHVLDILTHLVNRSMVVADSGHPMRYRMLETLRQYAAELLRASGENETTANRHALYFRSVGEDAEQALRGAGQREALRQLRAEHANLRAALTWLSDHDDRHEDALLLAGSLGLFWHLGRHLEGREILAQLLQSSAGSATARARALQAVSLVERPRACLVHPSPRCAETARESLELFTAAGDPHRAALSRVLLAVEDVAGSDPGRFENLLETADSQFVAEDDAWGHAVIAFVRLQSFLLRGEQDRARASGRAAADAFRTLDDPWGLSAVLFHLGWGLKEFGQYAEAVPVLEEAISVSAEASLFNTTQWALADLGLALLCLGQYDAAEDAFARAAAASEEIGDDAGETLAVHGRGVLARINGDAKAARPLFHAAVIGLQRLRTPLFAGVALGGLAWCDLSEGLIDAAQDRYQQLLVDADAISDASLRATALEGLAHVVAARGDKDGAAEGLAEANELRTRAARPAPPHERRELAALAQQLESAGAVRR